MVQQLRSEFRVLYLDDGTLGGSPQDVLDNQLIHCEDEDTREAMLQAAPGLHVLSCEDANILGSPI